MSKREAERADLYAVKDIAVRECICPAEVEAIKGELKAAQFKRLVCQPCQAAYVLEWLMELSEEA